MKVSEYGTVSVYNWAGLEQFGINPLTGEACRLSLRLLCDLNEEGRALMAEYLGVKPEGFAPNWNSAVAGEPAVASVMLHRDSFKQLTEFALFHTGAKACAEVNGGLVGAYTDEAVANLEQLQRMSREQPGLRRNYASASAPHVGSRNVHMATGRAA